MTTLAAMHPSSFSAAPDLDAVLDRIRAWAAANEIKPATLARQAGLAEVVTRDMSAADWSPSSRSIRRLEALIPAGWSAGADSAADDGAGASIAVEPGRPA